MGKCVRCDKHFVPDFMWEVDKDNKQCIFCKIGKDFITIDKDGVRTKYTKKEASEDYMKFLRMLKDKPAIAKKIMDAGIEDLKEAKVKT